MIKRTLIAAVAVALGASLAIAGHGPGKGRDGFGKGAKVLRFSQELNLTDAQKQQIRDLHQTFRAQNEPLFTQFRETSRTYRQAMKSGDTAQAEALKPQIESQKAQMKSLHDQLQARTLSLLTPEQNAKFQELRAQWEQKRGERGAHRKHRNEQ
jgi:protein CpxP